MNCCGEERDTPYCPKCGRDLHRGIPIHDLHRYLRKRVKAYAQLQGKKGRGGKLIEEDKRHYDQWNSWAMALSELLAK